MYILFYLFCKLAIWLTGITVIVFSVTVGISWPELPFLALGGGWEYFSVFPLFFFHFIPLPTHSCQYSPVFACILHRVFLPVFTPCIFLCIFPCIFPCINLPCMYLHRVLFSCIFPCIYTLYLLCIFPCIIPHIFPCILHRVLFPVFTPCIYARYLVG